MLAAQGVGLHHGGMKRRVPDWRITLPLAQASPRCGARTRTGKPCKAPAMACGKYTGSSRGLFMSVARQGSHQYARAYWSPQSYHRKPWEPS